MNVNPPTKLSHRLDQTPTPKLCLYWFLFMWYKNLLGGWSSAENGALASNKCYSYSKPDCACSLFVWVFADSSFPKSSFRSEYSLNALYCLVALSW